jgi:16S rRNA (cytosine967-C5)-methyltransferase
VYPEDAAKRIAAEYSFSEDVVQTWIQYWGKENTEMLCMYFNDVPALHIRINTMATSKKRLMDYFQRRSIQFQPSAASENVLTSTQIHDVLEDVAFLEGYYSVQDTSAMLVVELANPQMNESILDLFAAPGGKATYMSEIMANTGEIIAVDKFPNKIKRLKQAMERLQVKNIQTHAMDAFQYGPVAPAFDRVLLDVPCSGWGVFQKKAELRWQANQNMKELLKLQENALKLGASFVKPGGYLIYSTCTLNRAENQEQVEKFLQKNPSFKLVPASTCIPQEYVDNGYLQTIPFLHAMDGAFAAKMQKV